MLRLEGNPLEARGTLDCATDKRQALLSDIWMIVCACVRTVDPLDDRRCSRGYEGTRESLLCRSDWTALMLVRGRGKYDSAG